MSFSEAEEEALVAMLEEDAYRSWKFARRSRDYRYQIPWRIRELTSNPRSRVWWNMMTKRHKSNPERFQLTRFLHFNGVPPGLVKKWVMVGGGYDAKAWQDAEHLFKKSRGLTKDKFAGGRLLSLKSGEVEEFS